MQMVSSGPKPGIQPCNKYSKMRNKNKLAASEGSTVLMTSSFDTSFDKSNLIDGKTSTYWSSTGMFPQEVLIELATATALSSVTFTGYNIRSVKVDGFVELPRSHRLAPVQEYPRSEGWTTETLTLTSTMPVRFLRFTILSGWDSFVALQNISAE